MNLGSRRRARDCSRWSSKTSAMAASSTCSLPVSRSTTACVPRPPQPTRPAFSRSLAAARATRGWRMERAEAPAPRRLDFLSRLLREMPSGFCMTRRYHGAGARGWGLGTGGWLLGRGVGEYDGPPEAIGLDGRINDADYHPDAAGVFGWRAQAQPDVKADDEAQHGRQERAPALAIAAQEVVDEGGHVDAHERDECAEVEHLGTELVAHGESSGQRQRAHEKHVVAGDAVLGLN